MKTLYDAAAVDEIKRRLAALRPESERLWGRMSAAQMLAHCAASMDWAVGDKTPPKVVFGRLVGRLIKPMVVGNDQPIRRNVGTAKDLVVAGERDFNAERERLRGLIERFVAEGPKGCTRQPHTFFGVLKPEEWANLMYKHLDHHLRQFGV